jgi:hypothetical protein
LEIFEENEIVISFISELEILGYPEITQNEESMVKKFLKHLSVIDINSEIKKSTIRLKRRYNLKLPDCIIAATAIYLKIPLISADGDFKKIKEVDFIHYEI